MAKICHSFKIFTRDSRYNAGKNFHLACNLFIPLSYPLHILLLRELLAEAGCLRELFVTVEVKRFARDSVANRTYDQTALDSLEGQPQVCVVCTVRLTLRAARD